MFVNAGSRGGRKRVIVTTTVATPGVDKKVPSEKAVRTAISAISSGITQLTGDVTAGPGTGSQAATIANSVVTEAKQLLADNTTNDVSITKHGYAPKAPNDATKFLNGVGAYAIPAGAGSVTSVATDDTYISGGPITTTGTISPTTLVKSGVDCALHAGCGGI